MPPLDQYGLGYSLLFDNISIGNEKTSNDIGKITIQPFPYQFVKQIRLTPPNLNSETVFVNAHSFNNGWLAYEISCNTNHVTCNIKNAFPILFGKRLSDHVLVNNWANGWKITQEFSGSQMSDLSSKNSNLPTANSQQLITIVYWPQYLEYIGFGMLVVGLIFVIRYKHG